MYECTEISSASVKLRRDCREAMGGNQHAFAPETALRAASLSFFPFVRHASTLYRL